MVTGIKRYRVEAQGQQSDVWEIVYYTDSLPVAKRYAVGILKSEDVKATRVVDQLTEKAVNNNPT